MRRVCAIVLALILFGWLAPTRAAAQGLSDTELGKHLRIFLITFGPGDEMYEKFQHVAVRVVIDDQVNVKYHDLAYNWGVFKPEGLDFVRAFIQGRLNYAMYPDVGQQSIDYYIKTLNRDVRQQELNLTPLQKGLLFHALRENDDDSRRFYLYDYYRDNCCTRARDAIDNVIDHRLRDKTKGVATATSYRFHTDRLDADLPWLYVALEGVLGHPVDRPIDQWDEMFLPEKLHDRLNEVTVYIDGKDVPLVKSDETLYHSTRPPQLQKPPGPLRWLAVGVALGVFFGLLARRVRRHWAARWGWVLVAIPWLLLMAVGSSIMWWGWLATDHWAARYNENVMHVSVLALPLAVMLPAVALGKKKWGAWTLRLTWAMAAISIVGLLVKVLPGFHQKNLPIIALALPANLGLAYAVWLMTRMKEASVDIAARNVRQRANAKMSKS